PAPTGPSVPLNQPTDSLRHSLLTRPHAGVWRKLTEGCAALNSRCRSASMVRTERATDENLIVESRVHVGSHGFVRAATKLSRSRNRDQKPLFDCSTQSSALKASQASTLNSGLMLPEEAQRIGPYPLSPV